MARQLERASKEDGRSHFAEHPSTTLVIPDETIAKLYGGYWDFLRPKGDGTYFGFVTWDYYFMRRYGSNYKEARK